MILKLLLLLTTTVLIRCESLLTQSTSKPTIPKDLQELLDSLYMTGYIPEYIIPEDELTETEKTEGEYLDFPELKNAQDDVFVPPESEYSKNSLHYKNIKPRKRLIPDKRRKIRKSSLQQEILQSEISPEELRSDLLAHLVENFTKKEEKCNSSVKLDFLIPIPERGVYPSNDSPTNQYSLSESQSFTQTITSTERYRPIQQDNSKASNCSDSEKNEQKNLEQTQSCSSELNGFSNTQPTEYGNFMSTKSFSTKLTLENCNIVTFATDICDSNPTKPGNSKTTEWCNPGLPESMGNKQTNPQWPMNIPNIQVLLEIPSPQKTMNSSNPEGSMQTFNPQEPMKIPNPQWPMNIPNPPVLMEITSTQSPTSTFNPQWPLNTSSPQGFMKIPKQGPMNMPNPMGTMDIPNLLGSLNNPKPPGAINLSNPFQWLMTMSDHIGSMNRNDFNKEYTNMNQKLFTVSEQGSVPNYPEFKPNTTKHQPITFEIISPKTEKNLQTFHYTTAMQSQRDVTIKPALEQQIKSVTMLRDVTIKPALEQQIKNMLNIQLWPKPRSENTRQPETGLRSPGLDTKPGKQFKPCSSMPRINRTIHALEQHMIRTGIDNSSVRVDLKMIDKNIATNVVSLSADPSSINKIEADGVKAIIKPSSSVNSGIKLNEGTYFENQSKNASQIKRPSSQNAKNKERKYSNPNFISNTTGKENADSGKPKKKMFTFLNIFKKNKKYPTPDTPGQNSSTQTKREITENSPIEHYKQLLETDPMTYDDFDSQYPIRQKLEEEEEETFNHKRKKK